jgi:hypothetical protein
MNVTQEFIDNLGFRGGWKLETINNKSYYTITNPTYCQIFWLRYWYEIGYKNFANQNFIPQLRDGILTHKVVLDPQTGSLVQTPLGWTLVAYLGSTDFSPRGLIQIPFNGLTIFIVYITIIIVICIVTIVRSHN